MRRQITPVLTGHLGATVTENLRKSEETIKKMFQNIQHLSQSDIREFYI